MCLKVIEILSDDAIEESCLKERANPNDRKVPGWNIDTKWYIAKKDDVEVAFIELDFNRREERLWISQIFVLKQYRNQGLGTEILKRIEDEAKGYGSKEIWLNPKPLDSTINASLLKKWYIKKGFTVCQKQADTLEKIL